MKTDDLVKQLLLRLSPSARRLLRACRREAVRTDTPLYLVGGAVRDLLRPGAPARLPDLDLAVEGDALGLARAVAATTGATLAPHDRFGTAALRLQDGALDLARSRRERYPRPGALPLVEPAPIAEDLHRRDFSINAIALALTGPSAGALLDPCNGRDDLAAGRVRILHDASFRDDPTRLIRACRYAARIGGRLTPATLAAARRDRHYLRTLTAPRFGAAWRLLLQDAAGATETNALARAQRLRLPDTWQPDWTLPPRLLRAFDARGDTGNQPPAAPAFWALVGLTLAGEAESRARIAAQLARRCDLQRDERAALEGALQLRHLRRALVRPASRPSALAQSLRPLPPASLLAARALWPGRAATRIDAYLNDWSLVEPPLSAAALRRLGVPAGPALGAWLERLRDARIDADLPPGPAAAAPAAAWVESRRGAPPPSRARRRQGQSTRPAPR